MDYCFKPNAVRDLQKLPILIQKRIFNKLDFYAKSENTLQFAEALKDRAFGDFRFRIGDYRVIFDVVGGKIVILAIGHRKNIYKG